ncbi:very-long-chain 3-oxoacyl-CoA reductase-B isoform X2 [Ictalurus furcatus]|uniref:very-long-chain 3-oxoacyl-CoA reductase-B isoform X2 n=1 Tax=Ictalurus furcatus TaxID=66913 RepID=UPI002350DE55|nr:very-long-chain 3-oxoacyl-CoA reductase-B isoform X2 [Ictalurus furcatus]
MEAADILKQVKVLLFWVGAVTVAWVSLCTLYRLFNGLRVWVLGNGNLIKASKLGKWAVITGATDGIGKAYAEELARRGFAIVLISRTQEKLDDVSKAIVNNVGVSYSYPEFFLNIPNLDNFVNNMININITSVCQMTRLVLPRMVERSKGVILNVASASGMYPVPLLTLYSSSKAFVNFFSRGLDAEYRSKGIIIQSVLPFYVTTKLSKIKRASLDIPTPETYVASQLSTVGLQSQTNGYLPHAIMGWVTTSLLPAQLLTKYVMNMGLSQRARYLKKQKQG